MGILTKQDYCPVLINEDDMASNVDFRPPSQQSVKAYVDSMIFYKSVKGLNDYNNKIYLEDWESSEIIKYFDFNGCNIKKTIFKKYPFLYPVVSLLLLNPCTIILSKIEPTPNNFHRDTGRLEGYKC